MVLSTGPKWQGRRKKQERGAKEGGNEYGLRVIGVSMRGPEEDIHTSAENLRYLLKIATLPES